MFELVTSNHLACRLRGSSQVALMSVLTTVPVVGDYVSSYVVLVSSHKKCKSIFCICSCGKESISKVIYVIT